MANQNRIKENKNNDKLQTKWRNALMYYIITGDDSEMRTPELAELYKEHIIRLGSIAKEWNELTGEQTAAM